MGYGYGIWLVYDKSEFDTTHIGHVTVACFMKKHDALKLYDEIVAKAGYIAELKIKSKPEHYFSSFYEHDKSKTCSWGYDGTCDRWAIYKSIGEKYKGECSSVPHTSIEYGLFPKLFRPSPTTERRMSCNVHCVDIRSDFPDDWKIII